jgi:arylsulfatase A-like enzyme/Tfp pilus assembly protein PilF
MKKKYLLLTAFLVVALAAAVLLWRRGGRAAGWNLLVITLDTTRSDHLGAYGYRPAQTPNIDRLAREGIMFLNCRTSVPLTLPSHSSLFTGRYPIAHNVRNNGTYFLRASEQTLAETLSGRGYDTRAVVASFVLMAKFGVNQGFALYDDSLETHTIVRNFKSEIPADRVYEKFSGFLGQSAGRRFFYWLHFYDPHTPYHPPLEFARRFPNNSMGLYDGEIAFMDVWVGRVIDDLRRQGVLDRTLVVVAGDHGEGVGEHQEYGHGVFCYEEMLRVPLIIYAPGLFARPRQVGARVNLVDVMPTVLDLLEVKAPAAVQGRSFLPLIRGRSEKSERESYFESLYGQQEMNWAPLTGLIADHYKYISLPEPELYDLQADRGEKQNLLQRKNLLARQMDKELARFVAAHSQSGGDTRRELSDSDRAELQALGYISSFSDRSASTMDPKKGILIDNRLKQVSRMLNAQKLDEAEEALRQLLADNPGLKMPHVYNMKYRLYSLRKDYNAALNTMREAIEEFPDVEQFRQTLALALFDMGVYDKAEKRCREILERNPRSTRVLLLLGDIREKQKRPAEAAEFYERALAVEPQNVSLRLKYAELLITLRQFEKAVAEYNQLLENEEAGGQPDLLLKVALLNTRYGSMADAERLLARAVALKPEGKFFFNYALVLAKNGKVGEAMTNMETALSRHGQELTPEQRQLAAKALAAWQQ